VKYKGKDLARDREFI